MTTNQFDGHPHRCRRADHLYLGSEAMLGTEVEHLLRLADTTDR